jgi:hypothetical protein
LPLSTRLTVASLTPACAAMSLNRAVTPSMSVLSVVAAHALLEGKTLQRLSASP